MWIAARLLPHKEALALDQLQRGGYPTYAPRIVQRRVLRRRVIEATPLLFPSYVFVEITAQWHAVRWTPGIASLVMAADAPARVPDGIIAELHQREGPRRLIELPHPPRLQPGDSIRVTCGPLTGFAGLYAGQTSQERVLILLSLLGAARQVALPSGDVVAMR
jgi:transcriptional antiterminator RfaH